ncbi:hypothetical protein D1871_16875 [Nakamurella silvestris]|nr:hypothetical protein D1871_16875 [Nakamurella silvestris]
MTPVVWLAAVVAVAAAVRSLYSPCGLSMVSAITPFTEKSRGHRYPVTAAWFVLGGVLGGLLLGAVCAAGAALLRLAAPGGIPTAAVLTIAATLAVLCLCSDTRVFGISLPLHPRQVDETWLTTYRRWIYASGFGVQIGSGFATYIMTAAVYLTAGLAVLTGDPLAALAIGGLFGLCRGLLVLVAATARTPGELRGLHGRLGALAPVSTALALCAQGWVVVAAGGWLLGSALPAGIAGGLGLVFLLIRSRRAIASTRSTGQAGATRRNGVPSREGSNAWQFL